MDFDICFAYLADQEDICEELKKGSFRIVVRIIRQSLVKEYIHKNEEMPVLRRRNTG